MIAGELIFALPFHIPRFFRPTLLEVFQLNHSQLGDIFAVYGVVAMLCYFPGGILADRFSAKNLMAFSLFATALGGLYLATIPSKEMLYFIFGYWGGTSILLFWSAMIKLTRRVAGAQHQGIAFGLLDGGRGLVASVVASLAVIVFAQFVLPASETAAEKLSGFKAITLFYSGLTGLAGLLILYCIPQSNDKVESQANKYFAWSGILNVFSNQTIWLQGGIIICAYCGYKALDNYGVFATQVLNMSQLESANLTSWLSYTRPVAAIFAGLLADRWHTGKTVLLSFVLASIGFLLMLLVAVDQSLLWLLIANMLLTFVAIYALRAIYFALIEQSNISRNNTGTAVGVISLVGFTPDVFFAPITGRILDANPGYVGFQNYFLLMFCVSLVGALLIYGLNRLTLSKSTQA